MKPRLFHVFAALLLSLGLSACAGGSKFSSPNASGYYASEPEQCVIYARKVSDVELYGDAHTWWNKAPPKYQRGNTPRPGSVLVLSKTAKMRHGHVAVVKRVLSQREIEVTHSNWGSDRKTRRMIYEAMRVEDISRNNDWTSVRFWNYDKNVYGFPYAAKGFIYP